MLTASGESGFRLFNSRIGLVFSNAFRSTPHSRRLWFQAAGFGSGLMDGPAAIPASGLKPLFPNELPAVETGERSPAPDASAGRNPRSEFRTIVLPGAIPG